MALTKASPVRSSSANARASAPTATVCRSRPVRPSSTCTWPTGAEGTRSLLVKHDDAAPALVHGERSRSPRHGHGAHDAPAGRIHHADAVVIDVGHDDVPHALVHGKRS